LTPGAAWLSRPGYSSGTTQLLSGMRNRKFSKMIFLLETLIDILTQGLSLLRHSVKRFLLQHFRYLRDKIGMHNASQFSTDAKVFQTCQTDGGDGQDHA
jgi:hypothetical protein